MVTTKKSAQKKSAATGKSAAKKAPAKTRAKKAGSTKTSAKAASKRSSAKITGKSAAKKATGRKYGPKASEDVREELHEFKKHQLHIGTSDKLVTNPKQAIAIGLAKARREGGKVPPNPNTGK